jgi:hypothetical protein
MITTTASAVPSTASDTTLVAELDRAYQELLHALGGDPATLEARVSERCQVIGPKGFRVGKAEWISAHNGEVYEQIGLETLESDVQIYGGTAVRADVQRSACLFQGERIDGLFRVLSAWTREEAGWQLVAIQYTSVAPEAAATLDQA